MRSLRTFLLVIGLVLVSNTINIHAADPNVRDIKKVEAELADAQQRLEAMKARLEERDAKDGDASGSIKDRINGVVDSVKSKIHSTSDVDVAGLVPDMPDIGSIGKESLADKAGRKVREALGRDTLIDKAQSLFNDAKTQLSAGMDDLSNMGQETVAERTARRVREVFGRDTVRDKLQRKYNDAFDALNDARSTDYSEYPEKAQALKDRISYMSQAALNKVSDKVNDLSTDTDASTWEKLKLKLGLSHEPTATEKAQLIAQHLKDSAVESGIDLINSNSKVGAAFNNFLSKLGQKPSDAINIAKQWIVADPETREAARQSKTISKEAHEALDELLQKLLAEAGDNAQNIESIEVSVKPKPNINEPSSWLEQIKNKIYGAADDKAASKQFDPATGYEGMKDVLSELVETVKHKSGLGSPLLKDETYASKAGRKVRETLGRDTASDKLYQAQEGLSKNSILDIIKSRLPAAVQTKLAESDLKSTLGSLGEESLTEKAARKIRESVGKDTLADQLHHALDDIRSHGIVDTASNLASGVASSVKDSVNNAKDTVANANKDNVKESITDKMHDISDYLSGFTGETRSEKLARKVREALGRDTVLDKAHAKVDEASHYYSGLKSGSIGSALNSAADLKNAAQGAKDAVQDKVQGIASTISDTLNGAEEPKKGKLATIRDAVFGDPKDNKIKDAENLLKDAIAKLEQAKKQ